MKRILLLILALVVSSILIVAPVLAVTYSATITVTSTNSSDYTETPTFINLDNGYLVSNGFTSASQLDVQINDSVGNPVPFMPTDTGDWFVPSSIPSNSVNTFTYSSGNSPASSFPIIVGNDGIVTTHDTADLRPTNNFAVEINGLFETVIPNNIY